MTTLPSSSILVIAIPALIVGCHRYEPTKPSAKANDSNQPGADMSDPEIRRLDEAVRRNPNSTEIYWNRASAWFNRGRFDRASRDLDEAIRLDPTNSAYFDSRGFAYHMDIRQLEKALADYGEALRLDPGNHHAMNNRADRRVARRRRRWRPQRRPLPAGVGAVHGRGRG
jgi:tetratricopeptide (TPR) repeat protein